VLRANAEGQGAWEEEYGEREGGSALPASPLLTAFDPREHRPDDLANANTGLRTVTVQTCPNPVFVIGSPRSGTSVFSWSLAHHADLWTSDETEFISPIFDHAAAVYRAFCSKPGTFITKHGVDHKEFYGALGLGINALISSRSEGKRWVDQSPAYTTLAWTLMDMFPGSSFIHLLRDGRSVVNSMLHFGERAAGQPWAADFEVAVEIWKHYAEFALNFCARNPERTLTVRNEDLAERAEEEFGRIFTFLGVSADAAAANFFRTSCVNSSFAPLVWGSGTATAPGQRAEGIQPGTAADAWREWSAEQRATFTEIAGDFLGSLGYPDQVG
jgi:hypothetical protein